MTTTVLDRPLVLAPARTLPVESPVSGGCYHGRHNVFYTHQCGCGCHK